MCKPARFNVTYAMSFYVIRSAFQLSQEGQKEIDEIYKKIILFLWHGANPVLSSA